MDLLDHIASVLKGFDIEPKPLDRLLDSYFRRHRGLSSTERRLVADVAFGVARWRRRLDGWLSLSSVRRPDHRLRALCYMLWQRSAETRSLDLDAISAEANISCSFDNLSAAGFPGGDAGFYSFPDFFWQMLVRSYGGEGARQIAERLNAPARPVLRANSLKADRGCVLKMLAGDGVSGEATIRSPYGIALDRRVDLSALSAYRSGAVEVQDEGSQLAVIAADPRPGEMVFDACAGAGGKGLMMAMLMRGSGRIVASDTVGVKLKELGRRAMRAGASMIEVLEHKELRRSGLKGKFDVVFVDAPCSGTGTLRRSPDLKWRIDESGIREGAERQRLLISEYAAWVRPGGRLIYATCSILPEENERVVEWFIDREGFRANDVGEILEAGGISSDGIVTDKGYLKTDPRYGDWDCLFAASLVKSS
ncbi:MAG: RsmB/NOP family class I SAM-dependent RNA methyltransferase [Pseudomonadota bacterium]